MRHLLARSGPCPLHLLALGQGETLGLGARLPILLPLSAYANALAEEKSRGCALILATHQLAEVLPPPHSAP